MRPGRAASLLAVAVAVAVSSAPLCGRAVAAASLAGASLYADPDSSAARAVRAWAPARPADATLLERIAATPQAQWFDGLSNRADVAAFVDRAAAVGAVPVLVAYDLPGRDCGGYSAGGADSAAVYRRWLVHTLAAGIGAHRAAVILEPDALAEIGCASAPPAAAVYALLRFAVRALAHRPAIAVYLDAGNSAWQSAGLIARRLRAAGVGGARGFSLNVANFNATNAETAYGTRIARVLGGKPFVIDTSRNGAGSAPGRSWCNPPGRALGTPAATRTGNPLIDAYLWVKAPGESDGGCNGGPAAGDWWPDYALGLARRAPAP